MKKSDLNTFDEIEDIYIQAYNRVTVIFNLLNDNRRAEAADYASQFDARSRVSIAVVTADIKQNGMGAIRKFISAKLAETDLVDSLPEEGVMVQ